MQAILERHPEVCVVDELPHTNVPGSTHLKRWENVLQLLDAGIDVMTTMNIQHLESLNDQVKDMTGVRVRETIPDWVMKQAEEVVMVEPYPACLAQSPGAWRGVSAGEGPARHAEFLQRIHPRGVT